MAEKTPEQSQNRQVAFKARIEDILDGRYVKEEGWTPNYVLTADGRKISRVNIMGAVVSIPPVEMNYKSMTIDDGSRQASIRSFDDSDVFNGISIGDIVFVIGRPRQYNNEVYIMPEIIKKINNRAWIEVRKIELEKEMKKRQAENSEKKAEDEKNGYAPEKEIPAEEELVEAEKPKEKHAEQKKENEESTSEKIYRLIKELDKGDGAKFEEILEKSGSPEAENIISQLLMEGEIFELGKGKLKVLE